MLSIGLAIAVLTVWSSYKGYPTLSKRTAIKVMTIILTVLISLKIIVLIGISSAYYDFVHSSGTVYFFTSFTYGAVALYYGAIVVLGIIACVLGYKAVINDELTQSALKEQHTRNTQVVRNTYVNRSGDEQMHFTTAETSTPWQCGSCGKYNEPENKFCVYCGSLKK